MRHLKIGLCTAFVVTFAVVGNAWGTVFRWNNASGGDFNQSSNWSYVSGPFASPPPNDGSDTARFDLFAAYTVRFTNSVVNNDLELSIGFPTLKLWSGGTDSENADAVTHYTLDSLSGGAANISSPPGAVIGPVLDIQGGFREGGGFGGGLDDRSSIETSSFLHIGREADTKGQLNITGADWFSSQITFVGVSGRGVMNLKLNSRMSNTAGFVGFNSGSTGLVNIEGSSISTRGRWNNSDDLTVGLFGTGTINLDGRLSSDNAFLALQPGSFGTVNTTGLWEVRESLFVGGNASSAGGNAQITQTNGTIDVLGSMTVWNAGDVDIADGSLDIANNLTLKPSANLTITGSGIFTGGEVTVLGNIQLDATSTLTINNIGAVLNASTFAGAPNTLNWSGGTINITNDNFTVNADSPTGDFLTIGTDMWLTVSDALRVGQSSDGNLLITNGGQATAANIQLGFSPTATTTIPLTVNGPGSSLTALGDLVMGSVSTGGAQLVVTEEATASNVNAFVSPLSGQYSELLIQSTSGTAEWNNSGSVYLGGNNTTLGGTAKLDINAGGVVTVAGTLRVWDNATVNVDTGSLSTPLLHHSGTFSTTEALDLTGAGPIAALNLDGGTINAPQIDLGTNDFTGNGAINGDVIAQGTIAPNGPLTLGDPSSFTGLNLTGPLNVGAQSVTLNKAGFFNIGPFTTIAGGTLNVPNGVALPVGNTILANGAITGRLVQQSGSTIVAFGGDLTLGDPASIAGFFSDGELVIDKNRTITLLDANEAVLGSLTTLGSLTEAKGNLTAPNGLLVEFGKNVQGFGTIDTPNDPAKPLTNNGHIQGFAPDAVIRLTGYVRGVGTLDNVLILGTDAPGFDGPATVARGSVTYAGTLEIEIGGTVDGGSDLINHSDIASLGGTLDLSLIDGFIPQLGDTFEFLTAASLDGQFDNILGKNLGGGLAFDVVYGSSDVTLQVISAGDFDIDGDVDGFDFLKWQRGFGTTYDANDLDDWEANYGTAAPPSTIAAASTTVPEPSTAILLLLGMAGIMVRKPWAGTPRLA